MTSQQTHRRPTRREFTLGALGGAAAAVLTACGGSEGGDTDTASTTGATEPTGTTSTTSGSEATTGLTSTGAPTTGDSDAGTTGDPTGDTTGDTTGAACGDATAWATGGTAAMTMKHCYPDPFAGGVSECVLMCETTEGPCTADTLERQDVSEGFSGLPVRLALLVVAADTCAPIANAKVEIWHTQRTGVYSGETPSGAFCYGDDPDAENYLYFRGTQTTDAAGRVDFDTCFPGWYSGRAIHIHFRVYVDDALHATSQLFFADELNAEIFAGHPEYAEFGQPNTTNTTDNIIGGEGDMTNYLCTTARMPDGAMLASKVIAIRSSLGHPTCQTQGAGGGGMMPPPPMP
ncbi:protocatechuate 3,4-dioxygenase [Nannocystis pusilla]|uniref:Protocatechuate 3,4-dioxygenase n=1 Tax=Nannocystis pusilla TaxID=889268 RepID=A0ABS7TZE3_9BACT|nr:protocatechuate 3,4-dioxygenase [Nannocystis pusilla]MBZ5713647.1 protocatechuate 3,4-dioxygenase [Nannocystis pusilla]